MAFPGELRNKIPLSPFFLVVAHAHAHAHAYAHANDYDYDYLP